MTSDETWIHQWDAETPNRSHCKAQSLRPWKACAKLRSVWWQFFETLTAFCWSTICNKSLHQWIL